MYMGGGWNVVEHPEWHLPSQPPRISTGWEVVVREEPSARARCRWLPSKRLVELILGTAVHVSVGGLLAVVVFRLLIELAG
jgi:hypothetical protein